MKLDKKHGNRIEFVTDDVSLPFANMVRRYSMSRVPVLAIETIVFYDNSSPLWDEYISHRLGLMPIKTPNNLPASAEIVFSIDATGPGVAYASDMKSSDKEIIVPLKIPIITLGANQHLRFEGKALLGIGHNHAKHQSGLVSYGQEGKGLKFFVESLYQMEPYEVIERGCEMIEQDIDKVASAIGGVAKAKKKAAKKAPKAKKEPKAKKAKAEKAEAKKE